MRTSAAAAASRMDGWTHHFVQLLFHPHVVLIYKFLIRGKAEPMSKLLDLHLERT